MNASEEMLEILEFERLSLKKFEESLLKRMERLKLEVGDEPTGVKIMNGNSQPIIVTKLGSIQTKEDRISDLKKDLIGLEENMLIHLLFYDWSVRPYLPTGEFIDHELEIMRHILVEASASAEELGGCVNAHRYICDNIAITKNVAKRMVDLNYKTRPEINVINFRALAQKYEEKRKELESLTECIENDVKEQKPLWPRQDLEEAIVTSMLHHDLDFSRENPLSLYLPTFSTPQLETIKNSIVSYASSPHYIIGEKTAPSLQCLTPRMQCLKACYIKSEDHAYLEKLYDDLVFTEDSFHKLIESYRKGEYYV